MDRRKLPIGIQTFREIRKEGHYYVDKTAHAERLIAEGKHHFLSRPRRFGKSLFVDTLKELFEGSEELFEGLAVHGGWDWSVRHPVVRLDFSGAGFAEPGQLQADVMEQLDEAEQQAGVSIRARTGEARFRRLINTLAERSGQRVVVLVDEYDKPILDALGTPELARANRDYLRGLYGNLKRCDARIRFSLLTGVSRFSRVSLFSGVNNLIDITLEPGHSAVCGYTDGDLDTVFGAELEGLDREAVRDWYNGYSWTGPERVYNPFALLLLFRKREFGSWWFESGAPGFLIDTLERHKTSLVDLDGIVVGKDFMSGFDVDRIEPAPLLFQSGYLTVAEKTSTDMGPSYRLECPNREVRMSLHGALLQHLAPVSPQEHHGRLSDLGRRLKAGDFAGVRTLLESLFATIPYNWHAGIDIARYEAHFASVVRGCFIGSGLDVRLEEPASGGRVDMAVVTGTHVAVFGFKIAAEGTEGVAMLQLRERNHAKRYQTFGLPVRLVAVEFDPGGRNVASFDVADA